MLFTLFAKIITRLLLVAGMAWAFHLSAFSQNQFDNWIFGNRAWLNFGGGTPVVTTGALLNTTEGSASISDSITGALLFYTDGLTVWTSTHAVMSNGTGLNGNGTTTQSAIIVPQPLNPGIYYIITIPYNSAGTPISYSTVNMNLNGGLGAVVLKNQAMQVGNTVAEKVTAVRHANCRDYWIITHQFNTNNFMAWLLSPTGLSASPVISAAGTVLNNSTGKLGYLTPSADGTKLACPYYNMGFMDIVDFNRSSGMVSNAIILNGFAQNYGTEFSLSGRYLYVTNFQTLYQFDLISGVQATIQASRVTITTEANWMRAMRRGKDNRIYVVREFNASMGIINNPEGAGLACNYNPTGLSLSPNSNNLGIANNYASLENLCVTLAPEIIELAGETRNGNNYLEWSPTPGFTPIGYTAQLQRASEWQDDWQTLLEIPDINSNPNSYLDISPPNGTQRYRLQFQNVNGTVGYTESVYLNAEVENAFVHIFPNPSTNAAATLEWGGIEANELRIIDIAGKLIQKELITPNSNRLQLSPEQFPPGIYIVEVQGPQGQLRSKWVIK